MNNITELRHALNFTKTYKEYSSYPKEIREVKCLRVQLEHILQPIEDNDLLVGFVKHGFVGFSPQYGGVYTYYFHKDKVENALNEALPTESPEFINEIREMINFWEKENTHERLNQCFKNKYGFEISESFFEPGIANADGRVAGTNVDLDKLIRLGIPGLKKEIAGAKGKNPLSFYDALEMSVDLICFACDFYINNAKSLLEAEKNKKRARELTEIVDMLENIKYKKPESFKEGVQLFWIYAMVSDLMNYGRMDVYLGDLYCHDIDEYKITEEDAINYLSSLWRLFARVRKIHDCRVIIGGAGRRNEVNADKLALAIMEVSRRVREVVPQLTLRYYKGIDERLLDKALNVIGEGYCYPIIYSDETNVPAVSKAFGVIKEEAERYVPFGCGEFVLEGLSTGTPNNGINLLKALELTLHNGFDMYWNKQLEEPFGDIEELDNFDKLFDKYCSYVERNVILAAMHKKMNYDVAGEQASYLHLSLLMDDCIAKGKPLLEGGVRYLNATSEIYGIISCSDSLSAIKKLVYEDKIFTLSELVKILDSDFIGYERERKLFINAPKYGNDNEAGDKMALKVFNHIAEATVKAGKEAGLNKYLMVSVNNSMSAEWGVYCMASACGRRKGEPMSNGNGPSNVTDQTGLTALLNSMSKFDNTKHGGVINNIRFSKDLVFKSYDKLKCLIVTFLENNGVQLNPCCIGKEDLKNALKEPEKYKDLIIRIGGFSARFVELSPIIQNELVMRKTYDE